MFKLHQKSAAINSSSGPISIFFFFGIESASMWFSGCLGAPISNSGQLPID